MFVSHILVNHSRRNLCAKRQSRVYQTCSTVSHDSDLSTYTNSRILHCRIRFQAL